MVKQKKPRKTPTRAERGPAGDLQSLKRPAVGILTVVALSLTAYLAWARHDFYGLYALALSFVAALLIIGMLPRLRLGIAAAYLFVMPLLIYTGNTSYGYTKIIFSLLVISLLLVLWLVEMMRSRDYRFNLTGLIWPGLALLGAALLSLLHSPIFWGDFQSVVLLIYFFAFALLMANTIESSGDLRLLLGVLLASGALTALFGLLQYYGAIPGNPKFASGANAMISSFGNKNFLAGFLAYLFTPSLLLLFADEQKGKTFIVVALTGLFIGLLAAASDSAWLALVLSLIFLVIGLWLCEGLASLRQNLRWTGALAGVLTVASVLFTMATIPSDSWLDFKAAGQALLHASPAFWLAWAGVISLVIFGIAHSLLEALRRRWAWVLSIVLLLLLLALGTTSTSWGRSLISPLNRIIFKGTFSVRLEDWQIGYLMFRDHPLIGIGLGEYKRQFLLYKARYLQTPQGQAMNARVGYIERTPQAHNEYVQIAAEMGLVGLLAGALLIVMIFWSALGRVRRSESSEERFMLLALLGGVVAFLSDAFFSFPLHLPANALVLAFLLGALYAPALGARQREMRLRPAVGMALAGFVLVMATDVSVFTYRDFLSDMALVVGKAAFVQGDYQLAREDFNKSVNLAFAPGENLAWLAQAYQAMGSSSEDNQQRQSLNEKSISYYERSLVGFNIEATYYQLASLNYAQGDADKAVRYLDQLLALDPEPSLREEAHYLRALIAFNRQDWQTALPLLEALVQQDPEFERAYIPIGQYQAIQKQYNAARATLTKARELIEHKLADVSETLNRSGQIRLTAEQYYQAEVDQARLQQEKETVDRLLLLIPTGG